MSDAVKRDREVLKPLVDRYLEIANDPRQEARKRLWAEHFAMRPVPATPFSVYFDGMSRTAWEDILGPAPLRTEGRAARHIEDQLRKLTWMDEHVDDDTPKWRSVILGCPVKEDTGWGVAIRYEEPAERDGAHRPIPPFADGLDVARLHPRTITPDLDAGGRLRAEARELLDDRLAVHLRYPELRFGTFDTLVDLRGMDRLFMDLFDRPDDVHAMSSLLADATCADMRRREAAGWVNLFPEDGGRYARGNHRIRAFYPETGSGAVCAKHPKGLQANGSRPRFRPTIADEWPYFSDQTSAGLGPAQFEEFILPYHVRMARLLTRPTIYWHACEPMDQKMFVVMKLPNLKHFHVSPYTDLGHAIADLRDDLIIEAHAHPGNTFFAFSDDQVEADTRERMRKLAVRQCGLFLSDIHSINGRPERLTHWAACCRRYAAK